MNSGDLRNLITIQYPEVTPDGHGGETIEWKDFAKDVPAGINCAASWRLYINDTTISKSNTLFMIRYLPGIKMKMRIIYNREIYILDGTPLDPNERHVWLHINTYTLEEPVNG